VAEAERRRDVGLRNQHIHLFEREGLRQRRPRTRRREIVGWTTVEAAVEDEELIEAADRGDHPRHGPRRQPALSLPPDERVERGAVERVERALRTCGVLGERAQIPTVTFERVSRKASLDAQMLEVRLNHHVAMIVFAVRSRRLGPSMPVRSKWHSLPTEQINPATLGIDKLAAADIVEGMLSEDPKLIAAAQ